MRLFDKGVRTMSRKMIVLWWTFGVTVIVMVMAGFFFFNNAPPEEMTTESEQGMTDEELVVEEDITDDDVLREVTQPDLSEETPVDLEPDEPDVIRPLEDSVVRTAPASRPQMQSSKSVKQGSVKPVVQPVRKSPVVVDETPEMKEPDTSEVRPSEVDVFRSTYQGVLNLTKETVQLTDENQVLAALAAYDQLLSEQKQALSKEKTILDQLVQALAALRVIRLDAVDWADFSVTVPYGTKEETALNTLPQHVTLIGERHKTALVKVTWSIDQYQSHVSGYYEAKGSYRLPEHWQGEVKHLTANIILDVPDYKVTFDSQGAGTITPLTVKEGQVLPWVSEPSKPGHTFTGWYTDALLNQPIDMNYVVSEDVTLFAGWDINQYTVTFLDWDGTLITETMVEYQSDVTPPDEPIREGHRFIGWDQQLHEVTETMTVTARYEVRAYSFTVHYIFPNETLNRTFEETYDFGETYQVFAPHVAGYTPDTPVLTGDMPAENKTYTVTYVANEDTLYIVEHYLETLDGNYILDSTDTLRGITDETVIANTRHYVGFEENMKHPDRIAEAVVLGDGSTVLKRYYQRVSYTVTFIDENSDVLKITSVKYLDDAIPPIPPNKIGYTFSGWDGEIKDVTRDSVVQATYTVNRYLMTFDTKGGTPVAPIEVDYQAVVEAPDQPLRTGYAFTSWSIDFPYTMPAENVNVVANYRPNEYTVTLDSNGGQPLAESTIMVTYDQPYGLLPNPYYTGYTFMGWFTESESGEKILPETVMSSAINHTLYAQWTGNSGITYTVNHYQQNITDDEYTLVDTISFTGTAGETVTAIPVNYQGFYEQMHHPMRQATGVIAGDGSLVLALYYDRDVFSVRYHSQGADLGEVPIDHLSPYRYGALVTVLKQVDLAREDYFFTGWSINATTIFAPDDMFTITEDTALYAAWELLELQALEVSTLPTKTTYQVGEDLDLTGLVVTGTYQDASTKEQVITVNDVSGFNSTAVEANQVLTITKENVSVTFTVTIIKADGPAVTGVTAHDDTNELLGMTDTMAFSTDGDVWTMYEAEPSNLPDLSGTVTLYVRVAETATHTAGPISTFNFTVEAEMLTVSAVNGQVTVTLKQQPTVAVVLADFEIAVTITDVTTEQLVITGFSYDGDRLVELTFDPIDQIEVEQSVVITVTLNNEQRDAVPFIIAEKPNEIKGDLLTTTTFGGDDGVIYIREGIVYYNSQDAFGEWSDEIMIGEGTEADIVTGQSGTHHIVYTSSSGQLVYHTLINNQLSAPVILSSNHGGTLKWPSLALDQSEGINIVYVDTMGDTAGTTNQPDVMHARLVDGAFTTSVFYTSYYDRNWRYGRYGGEKTPKIAIDSFNNRYIFYQWRTYDHGWGVYHDRGLNVTGANTVSLGYVGSNTDRFDIYDFTAVGQSLFALYRVGGDIKVSEMTLSDVGQVSAPIERVTVQDTRAYDLLVDGSTYIFTTKDVNNHLVIYTNGVKETFTDITVGNYVSLEKQGEIIYGYYSDVDDDHVIKKVIISMGARVSVQMYNEIVDEETNERTETKEDLSLVLTESAPEKEPLLEEVIIEDDPETMASLPELSEDQANHLADDSTHQVPVFEDVGLDDSVTDTPVETDVMDGLDTPLEEEMDKETHADDLLDAELDSKDPLSHAELAPEVMVTREEETLVPDEEEDEQLEDLEELRELEEEE